MQETNTTRFFGMLIAIIGGAALIGWLSYTFVGRAPGVSKEQEKPTLSEQFKKQQDSKRRAMTVLSQYGIHVADDLED